MGDIVNFHDIELENKLKQYSAMKKVRDQMNSEMIENFTETEEETITVNQTDDDDSLVIEEDDDDD